MTYATAFLVIGACAILIVGHVLGFRAGWRHAQYVNRLLSKLKEKGN